MDEESEIFILFFFFLSFYNTFYGRLAGGTSVTSVGQGLNATHC